MVRTQRITEVSSHQYKTLSENTRNFHRDTAAYYHHRLHVIISNELETKSAYFLSKSTTQRCLHIIISMELIFFGAKRHVRQFKSVPLERFYFLFKDMRMAF